MLIDAEAALRMAGKLGLLRDGELYTKAALLDAFSGVGLERGPAERAFAVVKNAARSTHTLGALRVGAVGKARGRRYRFTGLPASGGPSNVCPTEALDRSPCGHGGLGKVAIHFGDNLCVIERFPPESFDLIYIDPPFNTGRVQRRDRVRTVQDREGGDRTGFQGKRYRTSRVSTASFADDREDLLLFLMPRVEQAFRLLKPSGSFFLHMDYREVHYCKLLLDLTFGRASFMNEIIWAYDYGGRSRRRWSTKHDTILWYAKDHKSYTFNYDEMDRIPYMAPGLVGKEKAARGKTPTDVWWHTIVPTNGKERTGYPTQKPVALVERIIRASSNEGDVVADFFGGSGTTAVAAQRLGRQYVYVDSNEEAVTIAQERLASGSALDG